MNRNDYILGYLKTQIGKLFDLKEFSENFYTRQNAVVSIVNEKIEPIGDAGHQSVITVIVNAYNKSGTFGELIQMVESCLEDIDFDETLTNRGMTQNIKFQQIGQREILNAEFPKGVGIQYQFEFITILI